MSHISRIELEINDLTALQAACRRLGLMFHLRRGVFQSYNGQLRCDHAIEVPGARFEIGVAQQGSKYELLWDDWQAGGLSNKLGPGAGLLKQAYTAERVLAESRTRNMRVVESKTDKGIRLVLSS